MSDQPKRADRRPCLRLDVPPGPPGLQVVMPALRAALDGSGPAIALVPAPAAGGATEPTSAYRDRIIAAVSPGTAVPPEVAVVLATSGSTGDPAGVLLPASALQAAARGFAAHRGRPEGHLWVAALPLHHAGGLMVAVRAAVARSTVVPMSSLGGATPFTVEAFGRATERAEALATGDGRPMAVSLVPAMLTTLAAGGSEGVALLRAYDAVLVGGAAAPRGLVARLREAGVRLLRSYGMTETCGGVVFDGRPLAGTVLDTAADGRLRVRGAQVGLGYRDGRQAERWSLAPDGSRCFLTDDLGSVAADGEVRVVGRVDDVVQVGGASVSLGAVAQVLRDDAGVVAAEVVALPDDRLGSRLVALVVAVPGGPTGPRSAALADSVEAELGRVARPRHIHMVAALPMLASGKPDRAALLELAGAAAGA
ncbi:MAG TPA: AMP-binding protein [Candidatus Nanopelagicales bacterium]